MNEANNFDMVNAVEIENEKGECGKHIHVQSRHHVHIAITSYDRRRPYFFKGTIRARVYLGALFESAGNDFASAGGT